LNKGSSWAGLLYFNGLRLIERSRLSLYEYGLMLGMDYSLYGLGIVDSERQIGCTLSICCLDEVIDSWWICMSYWAVAFGCGDC
jgi:hypothetical protein